MRRTHSLFAGALLALIAPALAPTAAFAQDATAAADDGDIIVTARKREERLQDVPIAVTAVDAAMLESQQVNSIRDVAAFAPGLNINSDGVGRAFMSIRGVGTTLIDTVQPGVGIFIDGIYQPNTSYLNNPVVDVARIEVLKGPQGTLFGNNTLGGAISVVTRAPTDDFSGRFAATYAPADNYQTLSASISGPIVEGVLRGRLAGSYHTQDGFSTNTLAGGDARPLEHETINGTLVWEAPQGAEIALNGYWNRVTGSQTTYASPAGPTDYVDDVQLNVNSLATYEYMGASLRGEFDITDNTDMTAILAYDRKEGEAAGDGDFGPVEFLRVINGRNLRETYTGELRFDTEWNDRFSTLIGVFADSSDTEDFFQREIYVTLPGPPPVTLLAGVVPSAQTSTLDTQAIFGTAFFDLTNTLELAAGIRFDHQEVTVSGTAGTYEAEEIQPRLTLSQRWSDNHMSYVSIARGFRGGGANPPAAPNPFYQGDSVWTYEIGDKFTSEDGTLTLNTSIYYNDYQHYIGQNSLTPALVAVNLNTGDVTSYGAEVETIWTPNDTFRLQGGLTYNHARITDDSEYFAVIGTHLPSDRILFQPDWNLYATPSLTFPVGSQGDQLRFDTTVIYKGERAGSSLSPVFSPTLESYTLVNGNISYEHGDWTIALWGTNLTDERYYDSYLDSSLLSALGLSGPLVHNLGITGDRRRVGVRVAARF
jgi:iron complex outermembrane receptor protein